MQALPSVHGSALLLTKQPVIALQLSVVQGFLSSHGIWAPAVHTPTTQLSPPVHTLLSALQPLPSNGALAKTQAPVAVSQLSAVQAEPSSHTVAVPGKQAPPPQMSPMVQALPSLQGSTLFVEKQPVTALQPSVVQGFLSSQGIWPPAVHTPATQLSPPVQTLLSALQD